MNKYPIRVLHVIGSMNIGGAETIIMNLYRNIDRRKIQFDFVVSTNKKCYFDDEIDVLGGKIFKCPKYYIYNYIEYRKWWINFFNNHNEYKIIHGHIGSSAPVYLNIAKKYGLKTIAHSHATKNREITLRNIIWNINSFQTRFIADYFMACSRQAGIDRYGYKVVNSNKFKVLLNGIDIEKFKYSENKRQLIRKELKINDNFVIGNIARFSKEKNHLLLLEIFSEIVKKRKDAVLLLVGDGEYKKKIEEETKELKLEKRVIFTGYKSNTEYYYSAMDIFCLPSLYEGFGISLLEAQTSGLESFVSNNIQNEVDIGMDLIHKFDLMENKKALANMLLSYREIDRKRINNLENSKFDIKKISEDLLIYYLDLI